MAKDLNDALNAAKKRRDVFSKTIIWESGISKSQFYRIIRGQETPSVETKTRIADSLGIDIEEFDSLFQRSKSEQTSQNSGNSNESRPPRKDKVLVFSGIGIILVAAAVLTANIVQKISVSPAETNVVVAEDKTLFIKDVTIPDGTSMPVNTTFVKTWRVKNDGNVVWKDRYLKRMTPLSSLLCSSPAMVPIPDTQPGETIDISVTFKTPHLPGSCRTDWKTSDDRGNLYFPDMHGLFSIVTVVED